MKKSIFLIIALALGNTAAVAERTAAQSMQLDEIKSGLFSFGSARYFLNYWRFPRNSQWGVEDYFRKENMRQPDLILSALVTREGDRLAMELGRVSNEGLYPDDEYWDGNHSYNYRRAKKEIYATKAGDRVISPGQFFIRTGTDFGCEFFLDCIKVLTPSDKFDIQLAKAAPGEVMELTIANDDGYLLEAKLIKLGEGEGGFLPMEFSLVNERRNSRSVFRNVFKTKPRTTADIPGNYTGVYRETRMDEGIVVDCFTVKIFDAGKEFGADHFQPKPEGFVTVGDSRTGTFTYYYSTQGLLPLETVKSFNSDPALLQAHQAKTLKTRPPAQ